MVDLIALFCDSHVQKCNPCVIIIGPQMLVISSIIQFILHCQSKIKKMNNVYQIEGQCKGYAPL